MRPMSGIFDGKGDDEDPGTRERAGHALQSNILCEDQTRNVCCVSGFAARNLLQLYVVADIYVVSALDIRVNVISSLEQNRDESILPTLDLGHVGIFEKLLKHLVHVLNTRAVELHGWCSHS